MRSLKIEGRVHHGIHCAYFVFSPQAAGFVA
jgi:hypothetical protein